MLCLLAFGPVHSGSGRGVKAKIRSTCAHTKNTNTQTKVLCAYAKNTKHVWWKVRLNKSCTLQGMKGFGDIANYYYPESPKMVPTRFFFVMCAFDDFYITKRNERIQRCAYYLWSSSDENIDSLQNWYEAEKIIGNKYYYHNWWIKIARKSDLWNLLPVEIVHKIATMCIRQWASSIGYDT